MAHLADPRNGPAFDLPPSTGTRVYVLASTPRTGSTLLARLLWEAATVGAPKEYLNPMQIRDWEVRFGSPLSQRMHGWLRGPAVGLAGRGRWNDPRLRAHLDRVRTRRSSGGWFGLKLHWHHYKRFFPDAGRHIEDVLGPITWIRVRRRDRLAQAVSWVRAWQTGAWVQSQNIRVPPVYDRRAIAGRLREIDAAEAGWDEVIGSHATAEVGYEALGEHPVAEAHRVLTALGATPAQPLKIPLERQADALNLQWMARYRSGN